ncbi:MAG: heterodisulfide reductase-related iron-sulfur binding cluster [Bacillota bacterium]|nr:heterodisulfide reductase-related iron-sulfur binding cluster [Bacillota bacterium]
MDMPKFDNNYAQACARGDAPFCSDACPFGLDVRDLIGKLARGSFSAAYKSYRQAVVFPALVSRLCDRRCERVCPRGAVDRAVNLLELERAAVSLSDNHAPVSYNLPSKPQQVAVIGGGPCGLAFALRLSAKNYQVTVYEQSAEPGGSFLRLLDAPAVRAEIAVQSAASSYVVQTGRQIRSLDEISWDAVFIATGASGADFGCAADGDRAIHAGNRAGVFLGGQLTGCDILEAIRDGAMAAVDVEKYLKLGSNNFAPELKRVTRLPQPEPFPAQPPVRPADGCGYTREQAQAEAARCLKCDCDRCYQACDFLQYHRKYPQQLVSAVDFGLRLDVVEPNTNNRMVNACSDCGLCRAVCPYALDSGHQLLLARHQMFEQGQISDAYHDFLLRDMQHALSESCFLAQPAPEGSTRYAFFPGCQLSASDPQYTSEAYRLLLRNAPDSGLLLACCGAPAYWAGDAQLRQRSERQLLAAWQELGQPVLVLACPSCGKQLSRFLPQIPWVNLWSLLKELPQPATDGKFALADPCSAKEDASWRADLSAVLRRMKIDYLPLAEPEARAGCCGYGGDIEGALPQLKEQIADKRISSSPLPYLCYCANCRDIYAARGKQAWHVLDLLLGRKQPPPPADLSARRRNREQVRVDLLRQVWGIDIQPPAAENAHIRLLIDAALRARLDEERLTEDDLRCVLAFAEQSGLWLDGEDGLRIAHLEIGAITVWLEYYAREQGFEISNVYRHRMTIEEPGREVKRQTKRLPHYVRS